MSTTDLPEDISLIRNGVFGHGSYGSSYLIGEDHLVLLDPGTSRSVPRLLDWFEASPHSLEDLKALLLTHIHLDHCGAAGRLVEEVPDLKVYLHARGVRHLKDPSDLLASVKKATGDRFDQYGDLKPIPSNNLFPLEERESITAGGRELVAFPTPGHAPHHLAYYDEKSGALFTGDGAGLYLDGNLIPATPPPTFNLELSLKSLEKMESFDPSVLLYSHFGPGENPGELLAEYRGVLVDWVDQVKELHSRGLDTGGITDKAMGSNENLVQNGFSQGELEMNVKGVLQYLDWQEDG